MLCNVTSQSFLDPSAVFALLYPDIHHLTDLQEIFFLYGNYSNFLYRTSLQVWVGLLTFGVNVAKPYNPICLCSNGKNTKWAESKCTPQFCIYPNSYSTYRLSVVPLTSMDLPAQGNERELGCPCTVTLQRWGHTSGADIWTQARTPKAAWMLFRLLQELSFKADAG